MGDADLPRQRDVPSAGAAWFLPRLAEVFHLGGLAWGLGIKGMKIWEISSVLNHV